ncbi:alpha/beta hydrolase family protein [Parvularcula lutaonensis]|uniref:Alpha/beta fold hydrolase n=1 Tax=Parvularcula lutaonensis TaxID=491923 RepID=A0ABV7MBH0_9PROT|nr:alpha/beta fold hydrolase [Parvularcula lutaonensis]GGY39785.1 lipoprotein [Parvularcula lutaonensis]
MVTRLLLFVVLLCGLAGCGGEPEAGEGRSEAVLADYAGDWEGELRLMGQRLPLVLHIEPGTDDAVTLDSPAQSAFGIAASDYGVEEGVLDLRWDALGARYVGRLSEDGEQISGQFSQNGPYFELNFIRAGTAPATEGSPRAEAAMPNRPQEPQPPFPYQVVEVILPEEAGAPRLGGTLTMPDGEGPFPGVVLLTGSGPQDRDETILGHKPFKLIADRLSRNGVAVLRLDDRGVGESGGDFAATTMDDKAADARRAMRRLADEEHVGAVGLLGHSEGGMTALLAAEGAEVDFIVTLAGPFVKPDVLIVEQLRLALERSGVPAATVEQQTALQRRLLDAALDADTPGKACASVAAVAEEFGEAIKAQAGQLCTPSFFSFLRTDPAALAAGYDGPLLALFGEKDFQVPPQMNADALRAIAGDRDNVEIVVVPDANHLFQTAGTGLIEEYGEIEETMREDALEQIASFVSGQTER